MFQFVCFGASLDHQEGFVSGAGHCSDRLGYEVAKQANLISCIVQACNTARLYQLAVMTALSLPISR